MNISKLSPAIAVLALSASFISVQAQDNPAQAAARAALEEKFRSAAAPPAAPATPVVPATIPSEQPPVLSDPQPATTIHENAEAVSAADEAQKQAVVAEQKRAADVAKADAEKAAALAAGKNNPDAQLKPIASPPLPISPGKQMQLDVLLTQYKADKISPAEYQAKRAAILAQQP